MTLEPAKSEPMAAVKSTKYCRTVTCMLDRQMVGGADIYALRLAKVSQIRLSIG